MSYLHKPHSKPLEHRTPFQLLHQHVATHPHKEAFVFRDQKMTRVSLSFQEYEMKSRFLAAAFLEKGLVRGDRVLLMLPTSIEFLLVHMALNRIGANTIFTEEDAFPAVDHVVDLTCVIACADSSTANKDKVVENIQTALCENKQLKAVVIVGPSAGALDHDKVYNYEKFLHMGQTNPDCDNTVQKAEAAVQMDDPALVLFTTGTTSTPKPIQYTNHGFVNAAYACAAMMKFDKHTIFFSDSPFDWISGVCFGIGVTIALGSTLVVFPPKVAFKGGMVPTVMKTVEEESCTHALFLSFFLYDLTTCDDLHDIDLSKLKTIVTGGQATAVLLLKNIFQLFSNLTIINSYGATEMSLVSNQLITKDTIDTFQYGVLNPVDGLEMKIIDEDGQIVPLNTKGELCVRGAWISFCNWDLLLDQESTKGLGKNGWHFTNDLASLDEDGKLSLHGRKDDMIKCATESISPYEMEEFLLEHQDIQKVCVVGVPDERLHEKLCACIILKDGAQINSSEKEIDDWCKERCWECTMGLLWKPHYYIFVNDFAHTSRGKLCRRLVREMAINKLGL